jgi:CO/xanthine dehydrogenase Mo-binding subunit
MAAEVLKCGIDQISVDDVDTLYSAYDKGSYASSTTYVTGNAVVLAARRLVEKMRNAAARELDVPAETLTFDGKRFFNDEKSMDLETLGLSSINGQHELLTGGASYSGKTSPPPFVAGFAEVEVDTETGAVRLCDYVGVVDCGTVVNKALARVQAEGGLAQGIGMALYEQVVISDKGRLATDSFMQYKIPSRLDLPEIRVAFEESYEPTGPFGAKSIGEVVINTPAPAILSAIRNAVGAELHTLPATAEKVFLALREAGTADK